MQDRFAHVDAMRGIAVLLVVWLHTTEVFVAIDPGRPKSGAWLFEIASVVDFGRIGVVLFFFISGFVIPASLQGEANVGNFIKRRFFRLYPAYWLSVILGLIFTWWAFDRPIQLWEVAANLTMIQDAFGAPDILGLYWTLRMELFFYGMCLVLFLIRALHRDAVLAGIAGACLGVFILTYLWPILLRSTEMPDLLRYWSAHFAFLSIMFTGALWRRRFGGDISSVGRAFLAASTVFWSVVFPLVGVAITLRSGELSLAHTRYFFSYPLGVAIFLLGLLYVRITWRPLVAVGEISYSLYLLHPIVISAMLLVVGQLANQEFVTSNLGVSLVIVVLASIGLAAIVYKTVELPLVSLGRRTGAGRPVAPAL